MADQGYNLKYTGKEIDDLLDKADTMNSSAQVPIGGTSGQVLAKKSATDYDLKWVDQSTGGDTHGIPSGGISGQVLTKKSRANFDAEWETPVSDRVQSVNGEIGAVVLTADDVGALAESTYDPQGRSTDIFKYTDKVANVYYATLNVNNWGSTWTTDQAKGLLYQQTATLTCANSHAPVVTAASEFLSGIGYDKTGVPATDDVLNEVQDIINDGVTVTAYNSVLVKVKEKPTAEIRARWVIQS
jgi:hypothetical protein